VISRDGFRPVYSSALWQPVHRRHLPPRLQQADASSRCTRAMASLLVNESSRRCLRLRANRLHTLENRLASMTALCPHTRRDRFLRHRHPKHCADEYNATGYQAQARGRLRHRHRRCPDQVRSCLAAVTAVTPTSRHRQVSGQSGLAPSAIVFLTVLRTPIRQSALSPSAINGAAPLSRRRKRTCAGTLRFEV
jgi:hypothetical protein